MSIMYDVHIAKVSIRLGVVDITVEDMDVAAIHLFNKQLRKTIVDAWLEVSRVTNMSPWYLDGFLWFVGRRYCLFDDEVGKLSMYASSCPEVRGRGTSAECPLNTICGAVRRRANIALFSARTAGSEVVVLFKS